MDANINVDSNLKSEAQVLFTSLGMDLSTAVNIFLIQSIEQGGIPFPVRHKRFNKETEAAMEEANDILNGKIQSKAYSSAGELFMELDEEC